MTKEERFWRGIDKRGADECWPFIGAGIASWDGRNQPKRRIAWQVTHGKIVKGLMVLSTCGNGACCNPAHCVLGKHKDRGALMSKLGRSTIGERAGQSKLTEDQAKEILRDYWCAPHKKKSNAKELAARYGVRVGAITTLVRGESWPHLQDQRR